MLRAALLFLFVSALVAFAGCRDPNPPPRAEGACIHACRAHALSCKERNCERGCRIVLDRLLEHEGDNVIACVAKSAKCDDFTWASCGARIGIHADGGPPAPPPPVEDE
jgi:hypothetical protein